MDINWIKAFAREARTDLESAKELFRVEKYGRVTFLAEQGVEIVKKHDITPLLVDTLTKEEIEEFDKVIQYSKSLELEFPKSRYPIPTNEGMFSPTRDYTKEDAEEAIKKAKYDLDLEK